METVVAGMLVAAGIYYGLVSIATSIIRSAVILADRRDLEKQIDESSE